MAFMSRRVGIVASLVFLTSMFCVSHAVIAATVYYVDPDWKGTHSGSASAPWTWLDSSSWGMINAALANDSVTIYFSARAASSDMDQATTSALNIKRTDMSTHRLTLDGMSMYNTNDVSPSWVAYNGSSRFAITASYPLSTNNAFKGDAERNYWTVRGMRFIAASGGAAQIAFINKVRHIVIENNELTTESGVTGPGPGLVLGSSVLDGFAGMDVTIRNNTIHDTYGEGIYIGGWYSLAPGVGAGDTLLIDSNTVYNMGIRGHQGDGIDIKDGWTNVTVTNNTIYEVTSSAHTDGVNGGEHGIILNSAALIANNFIYNMNSVGIVLAGYYSKYDGFWTGTIIRNNVVVNCGVDDGYSWHYGIAYPCATSACNANPNTSGPYYFVMPQIYNNTVYKINNINNPGIARGIYIAASVPTTVDVYNNLAAGTDGIDFEAGVGTLGRHENNDYWHSGAGTVAKYGLNTYTSATITGFESNSLGVAPQFVNTALPYKKTNFALQGISPLCGKNMGAALCVADRPQPPTKIKVQ